MLEILEMTGELSVMAMDAGDHPVGVYMGDEPVFPPEQPGEPEAEENEGDSYELPEWDGGAL